MLRKYLFIISFIFPALLFAGNIFFPPTQEPSEKLEVKYIETINGAGQKDLFHFTQKYLSSIYEKGIVVNDSDSSIEITLNNILKAYLEGKAGRPKGLLEYTLKIDFKDNKIRCVFSDFYYSPMKRNRYSIFEPVTSKRRLVSKENFPEDSANWKYIVKATNAFSLEIVNKLKEQLISLQKQESTTNADW